MSEAKQFNAVCYDHDKQKWMPISAAVWATPELALDEIKTLPSKAFYEGSGMYAIFDQRGESYLMWEISKHIESVPPPEEPNYMIAADVSTKGARTLVSFVFVKDGQNFGFVRGSGGDFYAALRDAAQTIIGMTEDEVVADLAEDDEE